jgi:hypothetical protein
MPTTRRPRGGCPTDIDAAVVARAETYFGFGARPPRRYEDGVLMLYDATGFALALGPTDDEIVARPWMHFGVGLDDRHAVRKLRHRIAADGVELVEERDEPDMSASSAAIRTATSSKPSGNQSDEQCSEPRDDASRAGAVSLRRPTGTARCCHGSSERRLGEDCWISSEGPVARTRRSPLVGAPGAALVRPLPCRCRGPQQPSAEGPRRGRGWAHHWPGGESTHSVTRPAGGRRAWISRLGAAGPQHLAPRGPAWRAARHQAAARWRPRRRR